MGSYEWVHACGFVRVGSCSGFTQVGSSFGSTHGGCVLLKIMLIARFSYNNFDSPNIANHSKLDGSLYRTNECAFDGGEGGDWMIKGELCKLFEIGKL